MQKNVDEAAEKLRSKGIEVLGLVCHVSNALHRKNLIEKTIQVIVLALNTSQCYNLGSWNHDH